jgi:hypothetical protein
MPFKNFISICGKQVGSSPTWEDPSLCPEETSTKKWRSRISSLFAGSSLVPLQLEKTQVYAQKPQLKMAFKNWISVCRKQFGSSPTSRRETRLRFRRSSIRDSSLSSSPTSPSKNLDIKTQCCGSGIRCLFDPSGSEMRIRDPGWKKIQSQDPGSDTNISDLIFENLVLVISFLG